MLGRQQSLHAWGCHRVGRWLSRSCPPWSVSSGLSQLTMPGCVAIYPLSQAGNDSVIFCSLFPPSGPRQASPYPAPQMLFPSVPVSSSLFQVRLLPLQCGHSLHSLPACVTEPSLQHVAPIGPAFPRAVSWHRFKPLLTEPLPPPDMSCLDFFTSAITPAENALPHCPSRPLPFPRGKCIPWPLPCSRAHVLCAASANRPPRTVSTPEAPHSAGLRAWHRADPAQTYLFLHLEPCSEGLQYPRTCSR